MDRPVSFGLRFPGWGDRRIDLRDILPAFEPHGKVLAWVICQWEAWALEPGPFRRNLRLTNHFRRHNRFIQLSWKQLVELSVETVQHEIIELYATSASDKLRELVRRSPDDNWEYNVTSRYCGDIYIALDDFSPWEVESKWTDDIERLRRTLAGLGLPTI